MKSAASFCIALLISLAVCAPGAMAQWVYNGAAVCTAPGSQQDPRVASDGAGGAIIVWDDFRDDPNCSVYAQRFDAYGNALWAPNGVLVRGPMTGVANSRIAADGTGGAVIVWQDSRNIGQYDIYAQRIDAGGNMLWAMNGVPVCLEPSGQTDLYVVSDGTGGAVVAWMDFRGGIGNADIYVQRIDSDGNALWTPDGVAICTQWYNQYYPQMIPDGTGGAFVTWDDFRNNTDFDIYAQWIDGSGAVQWDIDGFPVSTEAYFQEYPKIASDGAGGAIITWHDGRSGTNQDIYAQKIYRGGWEAWTTNGVPVCTATNNQNYTEIIPDGIGGAFIAWQDMREGSSRDIYAQRIDHSGAPLYAADGIPVCDSDYYRSNMRMIPDGFGGAVLAWQDERSGIAQIYAQRIDASGSGLWTANGVALSTLPTAKARPYLVTDYNGGAIVTWHENRTGSNNDIYAQRIERNGIWGYPAPSIVGVRDIPGDQGGRVNLAWDASRLDIYPEDQITHYTAWRAIEESMAAAMLSQGAKLIEDPGELCVASTGDDRSSPAETGGAPEETDLSDILTAPVIRIETLGGEPYYWIMIETILSSYYTDNYALIVETLFDSTSVSDEYHYFQVIAHGWDPTGFWVSTPDSGYSVDNLSPCPPEGVTATQQYDPGGLSISWEANLEDDLGGYRIYRSIEVDFEPAPANLLATICETEFLDAEWTWDNRYNYKLCAVDIHGNESPCVYISTGSVTGEETPLANYLSQNYPNPFNPATSIWFGLKTEAHVDLRIYDAAGRLVRVLVDERREAGTYDEVWNGRDGSGREVVSGIYFYRLEAGTFAQTRKMVLLR